MDFYLCCQLIPFALVVLVAAFLGVQILFLIVLGTALLRWKPLQLAEERPPVSVIVCAHDEAVNLRELVPLLLHQTYPNTELIIVDDRSNDDTYDFLLELTAAVPHVKMVRVTQTPGHIPGKKFALTLGIRAAKNEVVVVTDADCRPVGNDWLAGLVGQLKPTQDFVIGISPYRQQPGFLNLFIRYEAWLTSIQMAGFALVGMPYMGVGRNLLYRKALFLKSKGFNSHLHVTSGDDDLFLNEHATAANVGVCLLPQAVVMSDPKSSWRDFFIQKTRHLSAGKYYRPGHRLVLAIFGISLMASTLLLPALLTPLFAVTIALFLARWAILTAVVYTFTHRLKVRFEWWWVPVLDFVYSIYYLVAGTSALVTKKVRWKN